jgi:predicted outer membrane protein
MNHQNLLAKLNQIVEQAQLTLQDPHSLASERQRMIIALARYVSSEVARRRLGRFDLEGSGAPPPLA